MQITTNSPKLMILDMKLKMEPTGAVLISHLILVVKNLLLINRRYGNTCGSFTKIQNLLIRNHLAEKSRR
jgi:hypothetical protein